jgi:L-ascorbate metabolism protein UlaG (beta-lactamase superfamily)
MQITWLGHSGFRIVIADQVLLIDPWLTGNPTFPGAREAEAVAGTTAILITHAHGDHYTDAVRLSGLTNAPILAVHEIAEVIDQGAIGSAIGFGRGGTVVRGAVKISVAGAECGFMIAGEGHVIYVTGDTGIMADMGWMAEYYAPDIGILCAGGHYTMDMAGAAWAAKRFFDFKTVIPCHYKTFGLLEQSADALVAGLPGVQVLLPDVMETMTIPAQ